MTKQNIGDSITKVIQMLPEYRVVQRNADSLQMASKSINGKYNAGISVAIEYKDDGEIANNIANVLVTEQCDTVTKLIYTIKYDIKSKKIVSIKKE
jgi:hypothetical protein